VIARLAGKVFHGRETCGGLLDHQQSVAGDQHDGSSGARLAALKRGEIDIVYSIRGELAEELQRTPGLTLKPAVVQGVFCLYFPDQWDPKYDPAKAKQLPRRGGLSQGL
jgi:hypothetical protein